MEYIYQAGMIFEHTYGNWSNKNSIVSETLRFQNQLNNKSAIPIFRKYE